MGKLFSKIRKLAKAIKEGKAYKVVRSKSIDVVTALKERKASASECDVDGKTAEKVKSSIKAKLSDVPGGIEFDETDGFVLDESDTDDSGKFKCKMILKVSSASKDGVTNDELRDAADRISSLKSVGGRRLASHAVETEISASQSSEMCPEDGCEEKTDDDADGSSPGAKTPSGSVTGDKAPAPAPKSVLEEVEAEAGGAESSGLAMLSTIAVLLATVGSIL